MFWKLALIGAGVFCALLVWSLFYAAKIISDEEEPLDPVTWEERDD